MNNQLNKVLLSSVMIMLSSPALSQNMLGLYEKEKFTDQTGKCQDCGPTKQSLWYFENETIAIAKDKNKIASLQGVDRHKDLSEFNQKNKYQPDNSLPAVIWTGSKDIVVGTLNKDATKIVLDNGKELDFKIVDKISTNLSYYNEKSVQFFANKKVTVRGTLKENQLVARTIWLDSFNLPTQVESLNKNQKADIEELVRSSHNKEMNYKVLWTKNNKAVSIANKPVISFVLNGAQGDDDEAHGGHFAVATGFVGEKGQWNDWLVNNFYGLNSHSEKGITASILPMDAYQADLNSGQSWYRPSYMLVAVLKDKKTSQIYQENINRVFNHFYSHHFQYDHALANCSGINVDTLRELGWEIPKTGGESTLKAAAALPYISIKDRSLDNGKKAFDYLNTEMTNLYPSVAFKAIGEDLLNRIVKNEQLKSNFEKQLMNDIEAIIYVELPQFPSSRATGTYPIFSLDEYMKRVPEDKKDWKIVPVEPRVFPEHLKNKEALKKFMKPSDYAFMTELIIVIFMLIGLVVLILKRKSKDKINVKQ